MDIELELQSLRGELKVLFMKNIEKVSGFIDRHKHILTSNIQVSKFELLLTKTPYQNSFIIPTKYLNTVRIEKEKNIIQILFDVVPFTEFTIQCYLNSDTIVRRTEITYIDPYFEVGYLKFKIKIIPKVEETKKKRYSWFNK